MRGFIAFSTQAATMNMSQRRVIRHGAALLLLLMSPCRAYATDEPEVNGPADRVISDHSVPPLAELPTRGQWQSAGSLWRSHVMSSDGTWEAGCIRKRQSLPQDWKGRSGH